MPIESILQIGWLESKNKHVSQILGPYWGLFEEES